MKPLVHARLSVRKWGGTDDDYLDIHNFIDSSKSHIADMRHRALLHNSFGCYIVEQMFGTYRTNSDGRQYSVRDIAEEHIVQDLGRIPSISEFFDKVELEDWMGAIKVPHSIVRIQNAD